MKKKLFWLLGSALLAPMILTAQQNLLVNPGFEGGSHDDAPPWGVGGWRGSLRANFTEKHSGLRSLLLQGGGDEGGINSAVQIVPIDPTGQTKYHYNLWVKIPSASAGSPKNARSRWLFSEGSGNGFVTPLDNDGWNQIDEGGIDIIPPPGAQYIIFRIYGLTGRDALYVDDASLVGEPTGNPSYPGITGVVKDGSGNPVAGAVVFLSSNPKAQEFGNSSAVTDSQGAFTVCVKDDGDYYAVAWKAGYNLSAESVISLTTGTLQSFNPTITKGTGGRDLAISTAARKTTAVASPDGKFSDPQFLPEYVFDGNSVSSRYYNTFPTDPPNDRWIYVDLDPVGKASFPVREFVLTWLGVTQNTQGWPGLGDVAAKDFTLEYITGDPTSDANWASAQVAYTASAAAQTFAPVVLRLDAPITARAIRFHVTDGGFGPTEIEVNSDTQARSTLSGVVKDASTGNPIAGARVVVWTPVKIQNDPDIYGFGNPIPFVVAEEPLHATPYDIPVSKNIEQTYITDAQGRYTFDVHPARPIRVSTLIDDHAYSSVAVTPPADGSSLTQDFSVSKNVVLSGVIKNAAGAAVPNAVVQLGGAGSKHMAVTGADGKYTFIAGAGTYELYADGYGFAANTQSVTLAADGVKDVTLTAATEPNSLSATFDAANMAGWEIAQYDTDWVSLRAATPAVQSSAQNLTPGGSGSAVVEDKIILAADGATEAPVAYQVLQRTPAQRIAVQAGNTYNVYFHIKAENWVTPEHRDAVHYQVVWRDAAGAVVGTILSHPHWLYPQPFWYDCNLGHPAGADDSITLARLTPPVGAATLDVRIGWVRHDSAINPDTQVAANPEGSLLFVDDLVIDAVGSTTQPGITNLKATLTAGGKVKITYDGTGVIQSADTVTGTYTDTAIQNGDELDPTGTSRFFRAK